MSDQKFISIRGAREHNLKNVDVDIPRDKIVVLTGLSGSGKSSSIAETTSKPRGANRSVSSDTLPLLWVAATSRPGESLRIMLISPILYWPYSCFCH